MSLPWADSFVVFSPDGNTLADAGGEGIVLWEVLTKQKRFSLPERHFYWRGGIAFSPDGRLLASSGNLHETVRVWDLAKGLELEPFRGHRNSVNGVAFSPDGARLATASGDGTVLLWQVDRG
jgi:WD40 repeat protein